MEGLGKTTKNLNQDKRSPEPRIKPGPPKYEIEVLTTTFGNLHGKIEKHVPDWLEDLEERIILTCISGNRAVGCRLDLRGSEQGAVVGSCEHGNES
jgi:hypothetical protein